MKFRCIKCGECCRHLYLSDIYKDLDRGDGVCLFLRGNLCSIYSNRPLICNIDKGYSLFKGLVTKEYYYQINYKFCNKLQNLKED